MNDKKYTNSNGETTEMFETTNDKIVIFKDDQFCAEFEKDDDEIAWEAFKFYAELHPNVKWSEI